MEFGRESEGRHHMEKYLILSTKRKSLNKVLSLPLHPLEKRGALLDGNSKQELKWPMNLTLLTHAHIYTPYLFQSTLPRAYRD